MRVTVTLIILISLASVSVTKTLDRIWNQYKFTFNKEYGSSRAEFERRKIWEDNLMKIKEHNRRFYLGLETYEANLNVASDLTSEEFVAHYTHGLVYRFNASTSAKSRTRRSVDISSLPTEVDWTTTGIITPVKDQGKCGSCWAFTSVAALEAYKTNRTRTRIFLSEQNLVDCSTPQGNVGCTGGTMNAAFQYVIDNGGINTQESYPYVDMVSTCAYSPANIGATLSGFSDIAFGSEAEIQEVVAKIGPVCAGVHATKNFQSYGYGIFSDTECNPELINHSVLIVGYGTESDQEYWLAKNSWGVNWGINGYVKMARNKNNHCGIATMASYPTGVQ